MSVTYSVNAMPDLIKIGTETENGVEQIAFDAAEWLAMWPDMQLSVWAQEPKADVMYEAQTHRDGAMIVWDVGAQDTRVSGYGAVLVMGDTDGGERKLSARVRTYIRESGMNATADAPLAQQPWYTGAMEAARQAGADAGRAEDAAARAEAAEGEINTKKEGVLKSIEIAKTEAIVSIEEKTDEQAKRIPEVTELATDVSTLKNDLDSFTRVERSPNLFNKDDENITSNAGINDKGEIVVSSAWGSSVTDFIEIDTTKSKTLRQTLDTAIFVAEYKSDGTFISTTSVVKSTPITLNDETAKIRIKFFETSGLMVYQSDTSLPYEDYYKKIYIADDSVPDNIVRDSELDALSERLANLEDYEITNYALFVDTYEGKVYDSNGKLTNNANYNATSMCKLDRTKPIRTSNIYAGHSVFFDENKNYISSVTCYADSPVSVSAYPENAVYVAFDYWAGSYTCGEWGTYQKNVNRNTAPYNVSLGHTKKIKGTRPVINIYATDTQMEILAKLCDAFHTEDCDVVFERGEYTFDSVFVEMYEKGQRIYIELLIGGRCRYYFNGSTLTADQSIFNESGYSGTISLLSCIYNGDSSESYELYDGTLIGKGITYVVHDECGGKPNWYSHRYKNMKFVYQTDSQTNTIRKPIGGGTGLFGESIFENCTFETDNAYDLSFHGIASEKEDVSDFKLVISNCYLSKRISLDTLGTNQTACLVMSGCSAQNIPQTGVNNKWDVTSWCNEVRSE